MVRRCLLEPVPEFEIATDYLSESADALLRDDLVTAQERLVQADISEIMAFTIKVVGPLSTEVHRNTKLPKLVPKEERIAQRMPSSRKRSEIYERDGWRCRFCEIRVISTKARATFRKLFPVETRWDGPEYERHAPLYAAAVSLDHVVPHSRGGNNDEANLVTACFCCQHGRGQWLLDEMELSDPRERPPIVDDWDGLSRIEAIPVTPH